MTPHPYYQAIIDAFAAAGRPYFHQVTPPEARAMLAAGLAAAPPPANLPDLAEVADESIDGPHGAIPIRRYVPKGASAGTVVYLHSGGWVIGDLAFADATCRRLAGAAGCEIVSVDYRLAPEHPYPQPLDDCFAALEWAAANRPGPLVLFGESAGGNLAAACAIRARDAGGPAVAGLALAYPVTDHAMDTASYRDIGDRNWLLSANDMRWFWDLYAPAGVDRGDPLLSPLRVADAAGLPPAFIAVAELDPLREEGLAFARRLDAAGVPVVTRCDAAMLHGYLGAAGAVPLAAEALSAAGAWVRERLAAEGPNDGRDRNL
ncbi:alpha/beta hydrolase [Sphingomonas solaris]|uniref:Alpha/beta hydrolase n=1 Tax=Alterirhizorhabdus solaris TaxID=2529389 RepID=A0A558RBJ1_9SPHN|nr:alpha/beta hydrolase [Sphingomonas solaris]TVV76632.1 alpha/beta hydrolase [Sphingomonas solaris]